MESAGEARPVIWIATTDCRGEESSVSTSTTPHTLSCTNLDLALVTTREEGSTLCSVSIIGKRCGEDDICLHPHHLQQCSSALQTSSCTQGHLWVRRHLGVSTVVGRAHDTKHGDTRCYQGWPTSGSGPLIEYTSLDKLGYRCKDDLSSVSGVAGWCWTRVVWTLGPRMFCSWAGAPLLSVART